jgi:hypothetical protein
VYAGPWEISIDSGARRARRPLLPNAPGAGFGACRTLQTESLHAGSLRFFSNRPQYRIDPPTGRHASQADQQAQLLDEPQAPPAHERREPESREAVVGRVVRHAEFSVGTILRAYRFTGTFAFSSSNQFVIKLMCVTTGVRKKLAGDWTT